MKDFMIVSEKEDIVVFESSDGESISFFPVEDGLIAIQHHIECEDNEVITRDFILPKDQFRRVFAQLYEGF